jgi:hypothetical protein
MKSKLQKREEAAKRIKIEIDSIEKLPADQINDWRLRRLKSEYNNLINYKTTKEKVIEARVNKYNNEISKKVLSEYTLEDYLDDMEAYENE